MASPTNSIYARQSLEDLPLTQPHTGPAPVRRPPPVVPQRFQSRSSNGSSGSNSPSPNSATPITPRSASAAGRPSDIQPRLDPVQEKAATVAQAAFDSELQPGMPSSVSPLDARPLPPIPKHPNPSVASSPVAIKASLAAVSNLSPAQAAIKPFGLIPSNILNQSAGSLAATNLKLSEAPKEAPSAFAPPASAKPISSSPEQAQREREVKMQAEGAEGAKGAASAVPLLDQAKVLMEQFSVAEAEIQRFTENCNNAKNGAMTTPRRGDLEILDEVTYKNLVAKYHKEYLDKYSQLNATIKATINNAKSKLIPALGNLATTIKKQIATQNANNDLKSTYTILSFQAVALQKLIANAEKRAYEGKDYLDWMQREGENTNRGMSRAILGSAPPNIPAENPLN